MRKREKVLLSILGVGVLGSFAVLGIFGVFSATTQNTGNEITAGTVAFSDNDNGQAMYNVTGAKPGDSATKCIKATYSGSLAAAVKLYTTSSAGPLSPYVNLVITEGADPTASFPSCGTFTPDSDGQIYSGTLQNFDQTYTGYANGISTAPGSQSVWNANNSVVYRFVVTLQSSAPDSAQATSTGVHNFVWDAQSN
jgi:hypothetical protein